MGFAAVEPGCSGLWVEGVIYSDGTGSAFACDGAVGECPMGSTEGFCGLAGIGSFCFFLPKKSFIFDMSS